MDLCLKEGFSPKYMENACPPSKISSAWHTPCLLASAVSRFIKISSLGGLRNARVSDLHSPECAMQSLSYTLALCFLNKRFLLITKRPA
jgi:hypothetical protein